jgi:hypothetical protein
MFVSPAENPPENIKRMAISNAVTKNAERFGGVHLINHHRKKGQEA